MGIRVYRYTVLQRSPHQIAFSARGAGGPLKAQDNHDCREKGQSICMDRLAWSGWSMLLDPPPPIGLGFGRGGRKKKIMAFPSLFLGWGVAPLYRTCFLVHCVDKRVKSYFASLFFVQHNVFLDVFTTNRMQGAVFLMPETTIVF